MISMWDPRTLRTRLTGAQLDTLQSAPRYANLALSVAIKRKIIIRREIFKCAYISPSELGPGYYS